MRIVIGLGAEDRGDDAAGLLVARLVAASAPPGVDVRECAGDAGTLLGLLDGAGRAILVDAARGRAAGEVERVPLNAVRPAAARSTHGLGLAEALAVGAELGVVSSGAVRLYVVHGRVFDLGPPSTEVVAGVRAAAELILHDELGGARTRPGLSGRSRPDSG
ncbi:MAG TPA: hydrogenase maturation protease [Terriglobales bacterium]|nr:hydrogenase maturation protease [Terriglobales bacterium]